MFKVPAKNIARNYELTVVIPDSFTQNELSSLEKELVSLVKEAKGEVLNQTDWGKKAFAYIIHANKRDYKAGLYWHWTVTLPASSVNTLRQHLERNPSIIRYLLVVED